MLAADKLLLRSTVKQKTIELREKELNLFNANFSAVATQAALLAGFSMAFLESARRHIPSARQHQHQHHRRQSHCRVAVRAN